MNKKEKELELKIEKIVKKKALEYRNRYGSDFVIKGKQKDLHEKRIRIAECDEIYRKYLFKIDDANFKVFYSYGSNAYHKYTRTDLMYSIDKAVNKLLKEEYK